MDPPATINSFTMTAELHDNYVELYLAANVLTSKCSLNSNISATTYTSKYNRLFISDGRLRTPQVAKNNKPGFFGSITRNVVDACLKIAYTACGHKAEDWRQTLNANVRVVVLSRVLQRIYPNFDTDMLAVRMPNLVAYLCAVESEAFAGASSSADYFERVCEPIARLWQQMAAEHRPLMRSKQQRAELIARHFWEIKQMKPYMVDAEQRPLKWRRQAELIERHFEEAMKQVRLMIAFERLLQENEMRFSAWRGPGA